MNPLGGSPRGRGRAQGEKDGGHLTTENRS